ncbi:conserved unknown protein [Ectocarpus siliculosus]|uniref:PsbP C-terminal domain-containing protein n=1 Tax=Ectocarpus siliculosus TaxID=2880 RepID=D8LPY6_ECTSI|nr:conserved unknown protein [Ectocarpus siliculosus]|eukprot:CBN74878.1 conserved unknown protein [Ectocarpus siliculosus]
MFLALTVVLPHNTGSTATAPPPPAATLKALARSTRSPSRGPWCGRTRRAAGSVAGGGGAGKGAGALDGQFISKLAKRLADSFPLLTTEEIKKEVRALLNPETKGDTPAKAPGAREDTLAVLAKDVRELVEDLMDQVGVGSGADDKAGLVELKDVAQKFKGVLRGDPAVVQELRRQVLDDLEEVREEIEELLEVKELSKARAKLEKATAESTEMVLDSAAAALAKGIDKVVNEGKDAIPEGEETEKFQVSTYFFGKENELWDDMRANGVTRERFVRYSLLGGAVALGGNLFGVTSALLGSVAPEASRDLRVDLLFPIGGFKRFYSPEDGYEFMYPDTWVGDSGLALRRQRDLEDLRASPAAVARARQRRSSSAPEVAFGPQGGDGIENVSVVKSELMPGFSLKRTLGDPKEAAEKILSTVIAPPGSGREWELLEAFEDNREPGGLVYQFEYRVQGQRIRKPMRNVGVVAARGSTLFTVTVLAPEESWGGKGGRGEKFRQMANSFRLAWVGWPPDQA